MVVLCNYLVIITPFFLHFVWAQDNCNFRPVSLPITNVSVSNNGSSIRGIAVSIGSPPQKLSFIPTTSNNNTYASYKDAQFCASAYPDKEIGFVTTKHLTPAGCRTLSGGYFSFNDSKTYQSANEDYLHKYWANVEHESDAYIGDDSFTLNENFTLQKFPFASRVDSWIETEQASFGLGLNSSILSTLKGEGVISSKSWSFWWGLDGGTDATTMDGSFVFGGYDRAKIKDLDVNYTGSFVTQDTFYDDCDSGMAVTFNNITTKGAENLIFAEHPTIPIRACICLDQPYLMLMPNTYFNYFEKVTKITNIRKSTDFNYGLPIYSAAEAFQGDITFELDTGLSIRIANSQLSTPHMTIGDDGIIKANMTTRDLTLVPYTIPFVGSPEKFCLGRAFFTGAYLHVDNEAKTFTIWEANPSNESDLVSTVGGQAQNTCTTTSSTPQRTVDAGRGDSSPKPVSPGVVTGIVVGALALLSALGGLLYWVQLRRRRKEEVMKGKKLHDEDDSTWIKGELEDTARAAAELPGVEPHEVDGGPLPPQELWAGNLTHQPNVHELPLSRD